MIDSWGPWSHLGRGAGVYPGTVNNCATMGGGVAPGQQGTCGWTYKQWSPGMGGTYPSYSYKGWPGNDPTLGPPQINPATVATIAPRTGSLSRPMLSRRAQSFQQRQVTPQTPRGVPDLGRMAAKPPAPQTPPTDGTRQQCGPFTDAKCPKGQYCEASGVCTHSPTRGTEPTDIGRGAATAGNPAQSELPPGLTLDVRTREEAVALPTILGAFIVPIHELPLQAGNLVKAVGEADAPVNVYCKLGKRAELAKQFLEALGFTNVTNLGGTHDGPNADLLSGGQVIEHHAVRVRAP